MTVEGDEDDEMGEVELNPDEKEALATIRKKNKLLIVEHRLKKSTVERRPTIPRKFEKTKEYGLNRMGIHLSSLGLDPLTIGVGSRPRLERCLPFYYG